MTFYHATTRERIPSIQLRGLIIGEAQNFDCEPGIYLAECPQLALGFLMERALAGSFLNTTPREAVAAFCVIVIDGSRIRDELLKQDPQVQQSGFWIYRERIDVSAMSIISVDDVFDSHPQSATP